jgi:hypothetical protein
VEKIARLLGLLAVPIAVLNMAGGLVSGIWLAILGKWSTIGLGIAILVLGAFAISVALIPSFIFAGPAIYFSERNKTLFLVFGFLNMAYTMLVISFWCCIILIVFTQKADGSSFMPLLIWSYGVATGPLAYMASKEAQGGINYSMISTFFAQVAYLIVVIAFLLFSLRVMDAFIIIAVVMFAGLFLQARMAFEEERLNANRSGF